MTCESRSHKNFQRLEFHCFPPCRTARVQHRSREGRAHWNPRNAKRFGVLALKAATYDAIVGLGYIRGTSYRGGLFICSCQTRNHQKCFLKSGKDRKWTPVAGKVSFILADIMSVGQEAGHVRWTNFDLDAGHMWCVRPQCPCLIAVIRHEHRSEGSTSMASVVRQSVRRDVR